MDKIFFMGHGDGLVRSKSAANQDTAISENLRMRFLTAAVERACLFCAQFFQRSIARLDFDDLAREYQQLATEARDLGLFQDGGVAEKDHLNLWCLGRVLLPEIYVESGVFIGSSLHALVNVSSIRTALAIDPKLEALRIPSSQIPTVTLINDKDFSQLDFDLSTGDALVYFDDHRNSSERIVQAHQKGFRYLVFDDSTGLEGICQRVYPAVPTIPMIMNARLLREGDYLSWSVRRPRKRSLESFVGGLRLLRTVSRDLRVTLKITQTVLEQCHEARKRIAKVAKLPDLGDFIPQTHPRKVIDTSKFVVELKRR